MLIAAFAYSGKDNSCIEVSNFVKKNQAHIAMPLQMKPSLMLPGKYEESWNPHHPRMPNGKKGHWMEKLYKKDEAIIVKNCLFDKAS